MYDKLLSLCPELHYLTLLSNFVITNNYLLNIIIIINMFHDHASHLVYLCWEPMKIAMSSSENPLRMDEGTRTQEHGAHFFSLAVASATTEIK